MTKEIYKARVEIVKAIAHPVRMQIVDVLAKEGSKCVCELEEITETSQSSVSKHLGHMKKAGLVQSKKEGLNVHYSLRTPCIVNFFSCLDNIIREDIKSRQEKLKKMELQ
ncbi:MAG: ArsR/SmtB family transcription factor [Halothermotrichaceae bacterium]